ncbi:methylenetetrahydrofolate reductase [Streptomyces sp. NPDC050560]|uniref:methylenetetrahydrofolate reductase n=1 Tax=Streptomyces sp. NPDC050560 TaxID=3365630 RepID=UPI0037B35248
MRDVLNARGAPVLGAYVVPEAGDREAAAGAARAVRAAGADFIVTATSGPERSQYTSTNQSIDLAAACLRRAEVPAVATVTTWSRTVMALQAHLLGAHARGITRLVCGSGSPPPTGDHARVDGRWTVDAVGLIELLRGLNEGRDRYGLRLEAATHFDIGVRIRAVPRLSEADRVRIRTKIDAGAHSIVTSPVYTRAALEPLLDVVDGAVPVFATVHPLRSVAEAELLRGELPAGCVPEELVRRLADAADGDGFAQEAGRAAVEAATVCADGTQGVILSRADRPELVARVRAALPRRVAG